MKYILILSSLVVAIVARPQYVPQSQQRNQPRNPSQGRAIQQQGVRNSANSLNSAGPSNLPDGPKIYKYVTIHVAPTESPAVITPQISSSSSPKKIPDAHYQIIFIKAPSGPENVTPTEVELPPEPERRTLVYVLVKQPEAGDNKIKIRPSANKPPSPPEVFFIRYKDRNGAGGNNNDSIDNNDNNNNQGPIGGRLPEEDDFNQQNIK